MSPGTPRTTVRSGPARPPLLLRDRVPSVEPLGLFVGGATIVVSLLFLAAGVAWPHAADALLRLFIATLAIGTSGAAAMRGILPMRPAEELRTPFDRFYGAWTPPVAPRPLRELNGVIAGAEDERESGRRAIPPSVRRILREEAARRLAEHHRLVLTDPEHHGRIRSLVSEPSWLVIRPSGGDAGSSSPTSAPRAPPLSQLGRIVDELERL